MKITIVSALFAASIFGCRTGDNKSSLERFGGRDSNRPKNGNHGGLLPCTGNEPPRKGAAYVIDKPTGKVKLAQHQKNLAAWNVEMEKFRGEHPEYEVELKEMESVYTELTGKECFDTLECNKYSPKYTGFCNRYIWEGTNGNCSVRADYPPIVTPPSPPESPVYTCDDVTCPSNTKCEGEPRNGLAGCVEPKNCL